MHTEHFDAGTYRIHSGTGALDTLASFLSESSNKDRKRFILCDENTAVHCVPKMTSSVAGLREAEIVEVESGESAKTIHTAAAIWKALAEKGADRRSILINIGGGMITDLGAFCAATYMRGITFVHVPTTVLAQADASFGGKSGIDVGSMKNLVGVFKDPAGVFSHPGFFSTLNEDHMRAGFAEIIKHALIADKGYWDTIRNSTWEKEIGNFVPFSVKVKMKVVLSDPLESGHRKILNFGHTVGHALEGHLLGSENEMLHGEAVAAGLIAESFLSHKAGLLSTRELEQVTEFIVNVFGAKLDVDFNSAEVLKLMAFDKKNSSGNINFTVIEGIGKAVFDRTFPTIDILEALEYLRKSVVPT